MEIIARIHNDFKEKFGIPRQGGIVKDMLSEIVFEKKYRHPDALRAIDGFSHLWLIWNFSENEGREFSPTVRPPRLGGNIKLGVFATRSPFRPNPIGLSAVKLVSVNENTKFGTTLTVSGADMLDNTPIYDIKPYIPEFDSIPEAVGSYTDVTKLRQSEVFCNSDVFNGVSDTQKEIILSLLREDPKPAYKHDMSRIYGMKYADFDIKFRYREDGIEVIEIEKTTV